MTFIESKLETDLELNIILTYVRSIWETTVVRLLAGCRQVVGRLLAGCRSTVCTACVIMAGLLEATRPGEVSYDTKVRCCWQR